MTAWARGRWGRFLLALSPPLVAAGLQWLAWELLAPFTWVMFFPATFISAWIGGFAGGMAATVLSVILVHVLFMPQLFAPTTESPGLAAGAVVLVASGALFSFFHGRLRDAAAGAATALAAARTHEEAARRSAAQLRDLLRQAPDGIFVADRDGRCTLVNDSGCRMLGYKPGEIIGRPVTDLFPPEDAEKLTRSRKRLRHGEVETCERHLRCKDGRHLPVEISAKILDDGGWQGFVRDIGDRKRADLELRRAAIVFDSTAEAILVTDADARIIKVNRAYTEITGYRPEEVIGQNPRVHSSGRHDDAFYAHMWESLLSTGQWQGEIWNRRKNGEIYPAWENISVVRDERGRTVNYVAVLSDITVLKQAQERLDRLAHHDTLTGLANRLLFGARLEQALERARRHRHRTALLFLDLDRFKLINDNLGHAAGDSLLRVVATRLRELVRSEDTVARMGGDEFTVIQQEIADPDAAAHLARKLIEAVALPAAIEGKEVLTSTSVGIALFPDDADNAGDLIKVADAAMYRAKIRGRNTFEFYTPELMATAMEHLTIEQDLRRALAGRELELYYQPQFELASGRLVGLEALLRWNHPREGLVAPSRFIAIAEESGLIETLGEWVLRQACAQVVAWQNQGLQPPQIGVNISNRQMLNDRVVESAQSALAQCEPEGPPRIELEVTESGLQSMPRDGGILGRLSALGMGIAVDDFGTGYSSLSLLKRLPIDTLKIDRMFLRNLPDDGDNRAITSAMISMAHDLGLRVVAEGVEDERQMAFMRELGCDEVQGYLCGAPVPAAIIAQRLPRRPEPARALH